jgi:dGTPase
MGEDIITVPTAEAQEDLDGRLSGHGGPPRWRSQSQRDYDRILYSSAFQRLGAITQVTASEVGRPFHTRLTHTLKVAQVARRSAERLKRMLNEGEGLHGSAAKLAAVLDVDATEAAALGHDIGHPPFGHLAETVLNKEAQNAGGFEGNARSFRVLTRLALRAPYEGLDLSRRTLNGVLKYPWPKSHEHQKRGRKWGVYSSDEEAFDDVRKSCEGRERSIEACIMDWADDITYAVHDLDDFTRAGLIPLDQLASDKRELERLEVRLVEDRHEGDPEPDAMLAALRSALSHVDLQGTYDDRVMQRVGLRSLGSMLITQYIEALSVETIDETHAVVRIQDDARLQVDALKQLTWQYVIRRPSLAVLQHGQAHVIRSLWNWYRDAVEDSGDSRLIPPQYQTRLAAIKDEDSDVGKTRLITDMVAGMTERTAIELYGRMMGVSPGSVLDTAARGS